MPYMIIAMRDGDVNKSLPIVSEEDSDLLAVFDTEEEAKEFTMDNILCQHSVNLIIDLDGQEIIIH